MKSPRHLLADLRALWNDEQSRQKLVVRLSLVALVALFIFVYFVQLPHAIYGTPDTPRYLDGGRDVAAGRAPTVEKGQSYLGYIALAAGAITTGTGVYGLFAVHLLMGLLAVFAMVDLGRSLGGHWAGVAAGVLLIADTSLAGYSTLILTDYLYAMLVVITVWAVYKSVERGGFWVLLCLPVLLWAGTLRPNGVALFPIAVIYWIQRTVPDRRWRWAASIAAGIAFVLIVVLPSPLHSSVAAEDPLRQFRNGVTMWRSPYWRVSMPDDPLLEQSNWSGVFLYMLRHPLESAWLMLLRVLIHFSNLRPDVSLQENIIRGIWMTWVYALAVLGMIQSRKHPLVGLSLAIIVAQAGIVALTFTAPSGRFIIYTMPLFYLFDAVSVTRPGVSIRQVKWSAARLIGVAFIVVRLSGPIAISGNGSYVQYADPLPDAVSAETAGLGQNLRLAGFKPLPSPVRAGSSVDLTFYWQADGEISGDYSLTVDLVDDGGAVVGSMAGWLGSDFFSRSAYGLAPVYGTSDWTPGLRMVDVFTINIPADAPHALKVYLNVFTGKRKKPVPITPTGGQTLDEKGMLLQTIEVDGGR